MDSKPEHENEPERSEEDLALAEFVSEHRKELENRVCRAGIPAANAPDVVQDAWVTADNQLKRGLFRHASAIGTWFITILGGKILDHGKAAYQRHFGKALAIDVSEGLRVADRAAAARPLSEAQIAVYETLLRLSGRDRWVLSLKHIEGFTVPEIAAQLGWSERQVERVLKQARKRFQEIFTSGANTTANRLIDKGGRDNVR